MTVPGAVHRAAEVRTERLIEELLQIQGWDIRRPPSGDVLAQQEFRDFPALREALAASSKSGSGGGIPEYLVVDRSGSRPLAVFEGKPRKGDLAQAIIDVEGYGDGFRSSGFSPVVIAVAGTRDDQFAVRVKKWHSGAWTEITYDGKPVEWIPNRKQLDAILGTPELLELRPVVPGPEVLRARADEINRSLREAGLKDDFRPAAIGAIMLGLWRSKGNIRRESEHILADINRACEEAFTKAGKPELAHSIRVDEANPKLAAKAPRICQILERLNITTLTAEHDYLGTLYEEFFRYTGGNTIGQYFTPRHITRLMADLTHVVRDDIVLDPACGTGGFLIAAMERMQRTARLPREAVVAIVKEHLIGIEDEPVTAALCVANMILRGDGTTGVLRADAFDDSQYPFGRASVALMNPPFPHEKTDVPPEKFIDRALSGLRVRGLAAVIVPSSLLTKSTKAQWRRGVLAANTLRAVISLPGELFQPYASATTAIVMFERGTPHPAGQQVFFARIENDGLRIKKGVRVPVEGSQLPELLAGFEAGLSTPEFCTWAKVRESSGWAPGAYIEARPLAPDALRSEVGVLLRNKSAFVVRYAPEVARLQRLVAAGEIVPHAPLRRRGLLSSGTGTIGDSFDIRYGLRELHSKERLTPGGALVISSSGADNGAYGFFDFADVLATPFVTVPSTGSIGEASVQEYPCGVADDALLLLPKEGVPVEALYVAAATVRRERWRFDYGRKMTPERIEGFPIRLDDDVLSWVGRQREVAMKLEEAALEAYAGEPEPVSEPDNGEPGDDGFTRADFEAALRKVTRRGVPSQLAEGTSET